MECVGDEDGDGTENHEPLGLMLVVVYNIYKGL